MAKKTLEKEPKPKKEKKPVKQKAIEETLWESANKLRGTVESAEYKHVVLSRPKISRSTGNSSLPIRKLLITSID